MSSSRKRKIEAEMQRVLAELVAREIRDPRVGNVTITAVSLTADMSQAQVFFTPFAGRQRPEEVLEGLTSAGGFLRGEVGRRLGLRHAPQLKFVIDDMPQRAAELTSLIERAVTLDKARSEEGAEPQQTDEAD